MFTFKHEIEHCINLMHSSLFFVFNLISNIDLHDGLLYINQGGKKGARRCHLNIKLLIIMFA